MAKKFKSEIDVKKPDNSRWETGGFMVIEPKKKKSKKTKRSK